MRVTPQGFAGLTRSVMEMADSCCEGKVVITLEGGYDLKGLRDSVKAVLMELAGLSGANTTDFVTKADRQTLGYLIKSVKKIHGQYWKNL